MRRHHDTKVPWSLARAQRRGGARGSRAPALVLVSAAHRRQHGAAIMADTGSTSLRLFVALWPGDEERRHLDALAHGLSLAHGRLVPARNLHLTLAFLGAADAERHACIARALATVSAPAFDLQFGTIRYRRRSAMVWLEASEVPPALAELVAGVRRALAGCAYVPDARAFRAHVTLARDARGWRASQTEVALVWRVREFCLVSSRLTPAGAEYAIERRWALAR